MVDDGSERKDGNRIQRLYIMHDVWNVAATDRVSNVMRI